jgi:choline-sulfatase
VGAAPTPEDQDLPGQSLWTIAQAADQERTVFSEYHAVGSRHASFMLRNSRYKYVYYVNDPPQLFDLVTDSQESHDLAASPAHQEVLQAFEAQLRVMLDPEAVDAQAKASQRAKVAAFGGEAAVRRRGSFSNSPVPGEAPAFSRFD